MQRGWAGACPGSRFVMDCGAPLQYETCAMGSELHQLPPDALLPYSSRHMPRLQGSGSTAVQRIAPPPLPPPHTQCLPRLPPAADQPGAHLYLRQNLSL